MPVRNFEPINPLTDISNTRTFLHEVIPVTGSIPSGTYSDNNIKNYTHGMFQSVYDYPYLSSSANHIFDLTMGYAGNSALSASANIQNTKKINMYNQFAQTLLGFTGSANNIRPFESDLLLDLTGSMKEVFFINFSRLLTKDEIKNVQDLDMWLEVDGHRYQHSNTQQMLFTVTHLISYLSNFMTLNPGDVISSGTPPGVGVGVKPKPVYLQAGQVVKASICGLGEQRHKIVAYK